MVHLATTHVQLIQVTTTTSIHAYIVDLLRQVFQERRYTWQGAFHDANYHSFRRVTTTMGIYVIIDFQFKDSTQIQYRLGGDCGSEEGLIN